MVVYVHNRKKEEKEKYEEKNERYSSIPHLPGSTLDTFPEVEFLELMPLRSKPEFVLFNLKCLILRVH